MGQGDGGLLHRQNETLRGPPHQPGHHWSPRLHGVHQNPLLLVQWHQFKNIHLLCVHPYTLIAVLSFVFTNLSLQWMYLAALSTILTIVKCDALWRVLSYPPSLLL